MEEDSATLQRVLERTLRHAPEEFAAWTQREQKVLRDAVQRHAGIPFSFDPVVLDIVDALTQLSLGLNDRNTSTHREIAHAVARVLWEDHRCRERLERLRDWINEQS